MLTCTISALTPCSAARKGLSSNTRHGDILINLFICWTASLSCSSTRLSPMGRKKSRNQGSSQTVSARRNGAHIGRSFFPLTATVQQGRDTLVISWRNNILSAFKSKFPAGTTREQCGFYRDAAVSDNSRKCRTVAKSSDDIFVTETAPNSSPVEKSAVSHYD